MLKSRKVPPRAQARKKRGRFLTRPKRGCSMRSPNKRTAKDCGHIAAHNLALLAFLSIIPLPSRPTIVYVPCVRGVRQQPPSQASRRTSSPCLTLLSPLVPYLLEYDAQQNLFLFREIVLLYTAGTLHYILMTLVVFTTVCLLFTRYIFISHPRDVL